MEGAGPGRGRPTTAARCSPDLDRMTPGDMPTSTRPWSWPRRRSPRCPTPPIKHMIVISDGDPSPPTPAVVSALKKLKVTVTTVAVGRTARPGSNVLQQIGHGHRRQVLRGEESQGLAEDLPARGPPRRPAADLRNEGRRASAGPASRTKCIGGIDGSAAADPRLRDDDRQGQPAGRGLAHLARAVRRTQQHDPGQLDLRAGEDGGASPPTPAQRWTTSGPAGRTTTSSSAKSSAGRCAQRRHRQVQRRHARSRTARPRSSSPPWTRTTSSSTF